MKNTSSDAGFFLFLVFWKQSDTSIIHDASRYIQELKHKLEILNEDTATAQNSSNNQSSLPVVHNLTQLFT